MNSLQMLSRIQQPASFNISQSLSPYAHLPMYSYELILLAQSPRHKLDPYAVHIIVHPLILTVTLLPSVGMGRSSFVISSMVL